MSKKREEPCNDTETRKAFALFLVLGHVIRDGLPTLQQKSSFSKEIWELADELADGESQ